MCLNPPGASSKAHWRARHPFCLFSAGAVKAPFLHVTSWMFSQFGFCADETGCAIMSFKRFGLICTFKCTEASISSVYARLSYPSPSSSFLSKGAICKFFSLKYLKNCEAAEPRTSSGTGTHSGATTLQQSLLCTLKTSSFQQSWAPMLMVQTTPALTR